MGRMASTPVRFGSRPVRIAAQTAGTEQARSKWRDDTQPWRRWYKLARWRALRWDVLVRDLFTCRRCGLVLAETSQLVADHIRPHRGDEALFWDDANLQCLCKACHDRDKQAEERAGR